MFVMSPAKARTNLLPGTPLTPTIVEPLRTQATHRALLGKCNGAGRVYEVRLTGETVLRGGHPPVYVTADFTSCKLVSRGNRNQSQSTFLMHAHGW